MEKRRVRHGLVVAAAAIAGAAVLAALLYGLFVLGTIVFWETADFTF